MKKRLADEVVGHRSHAHPIQESLHDSDHPNRARHVLDRQKSAARTEHALDLSDYGAVIRNRAKSERAHHGVEAVVRKLESLSVAHPELHLPAQTTHSCLRNLEYLLAE